MKNLIMFNALFNHLVLVGNQMKASADDFYVSGDYGIYKFLKAEMMEQYEFSGMISEYVKKMHKVAVTYTDKAAPMQGKASIQTLQNILEMEHASIKLICEMIAKEDMVIYRPFLSDLHYKLLKEYREICDIINDMNKISTNAAALIRYDKMLYEEYKDYKYKYCLKYMKQYDSDD